MVDDVERATEGLLRLERTRRARTRRLGCLLVLLLTAMLAAGAVWWYEGQPSWQRIQRDLLRGAALIRDALETGVMPRL